MSNFGQVHVLKMVLLTQLCAWVRGYVGTWVRGYVAVLVIDSGERFVDIAFVV